MSDIAIRVRGQSLKAYVDGVGYLLLRQARKVATDSEHWRCQTWSRSRRWVTASEIIRVRHQAEIKNRARELRNVATASA